MNPVDLVLSKIGGKQTRHTDGSVQVRCPAHDDKQASCNVQSSADGRALIKCYAGCSAEAILGAIGLSFKDLFPQASATAVTVYDYVDANGRTLYQVLRKPGKQFAQRRPDGKGGWFHNLQNIPRVPFRLPALRQAAKDGVPVWIVEGEKDVLALEAAGAVATCNSGGAGRWLKSFGELFRGVPEVIIVQDKDEPGVEHATLVATSLKNIVPKIRIVEAAQGKDAYDHLMSKGESLSTFLDVGNDALNPELRVLDLTQSTPISIDWLWYPYIPRGLITFIDGAPGLGKTYVTMAIAAGLSIGGNTLPGQEEPVPPMKVMICNAEDAPDEDTLRMVLLPRLLSFGANLSNIIPLIGEWDFSPQGLKRLEQYIQKYRPDLLIVDPLFSFIGESVEINSDNAAKAVMYRFGRLLAKYHVAAVCVRHTTKGSAQNKVLIERGIGSIGWVGAARSALVLDRDEEDRNLCYLRHSKHNLVGRGNDLAYRIEHGTFYWVHESPLDVLGDSVDELCKWLRLALSNGPKEAGALYDARKIFDHESAEAKRLRRAADKIGVIKKRTGFQGKTIWALPYHPSLEAGDKSLPVDK